MNSISPPWLTHKATQAVFNAITEPGYQVLFVGGCVRDALLGKTVHDIDIATSAPPTQVTGLCRAAGLKVVETGIKHGTVTVISSGIAHQVTTFRRDITTDGRHAQVAFTDMIEVDARRRDFTINALYATQQGRILDPLEGETDLQTHRVRFIDDPCQRIREDYLRILRFFRFHAWYGDQKHGLDANGLAACAQNLGGLETLSRERIGAEMKKLLAAPDPAPSIAAMAQTGVLQKVLPGAQAKTLPILVHLEARARVTSDAIRRLVSLTAQNCGSDLRLSRKEARRAAELKRQTQSKGGPAALGYQLGPVVALDVLLLRAAFFETKLATNAIAEIQTGAQAVFPVSPTDLMPRWTGAALGQRLSDLELKWIASGFSLGKSELLG